MLLSKQVSIFIRSVLFIQNIHTGFFVEAFFSRKGYRKMFFLIFHDKGLLFYSTVTTLYSNVEVIVHAATSVSLQCAQV